MLLLTREDIEQVVDMNDNIEAAVTAYKMFNNGEVESPLRTIIQSQNEEGSMLTMPAYAPGLEMAAVKIVSVFPNNVKQGKPATPAQVVLMDAKTGIIIALMDGTYITQLRTGAASGAFLKNFAKADSKIGALIGTGGQGACQLEAMLCACPSLEEVRVYDLDFERAKAFAEDMGAKLADHGAKIVPVQSSDEAIDNADVLITVTVARQPVFDATKIKPGCSISCVGSFQPDMQEMDPRILNMAGKVYCDSVEMVMEESGDLIKPINEGTFKLEDITGDIGEALLGKVAGRESDDEIMVFETVGIGVQDLTAAKLIYEKALDARVGTNWGE